MWVCPDTGSAYLIIYIEHHSLKIMTEEILLVNKGKEEGCNLGNPAISKPPHIHHVKVKVYFLPLDVVMSVFDTFIICNVFIVSV